MPRFQSPRNANGGARARARDAFFDLSFFRNELDPSVAGARYRRRVRIHSNEIFETFSLSLSLSLSLSRSHNKRLISVGRHVAPESRQR